MKKIMMIAAMMVATLSANAQNEVGQFSLKPTVGLNIANITKFANSKVRPGLNIGLEGEYGVTEKFGVTAGFFYSQQGVKINNIELGLDWFDDNTDEQLFLGRSRVVVKETEFGIEIKIAGNTYAKSLDCIHEFINRLNAGRIRLGDDTTLGKGLCVCRTLDTISLRFIRRLHDLHYTFDGQNECSGILISAHCDDGLFITNRAMFKGWNKSLNMIPASTWKGIFRNASNDWAEYMGEGTEIINRMFGNRSLGIKGCLIFYDSAISNPKTIFGVRTHIDKFSASTIGDDLERFRIKEYVTGAFSIRIECTENIELYKKYIYTVLRDLHAGRINVGADKGIGKGYIKIDRVKEWNN